MKIKGQVFLLFCASAMLLFCGCHSNPTTVDSQSTNPPTATLHISQLVPKGCWINSRYKAALLKTKSLIEAQNALWEDTANSANIDQVVFYGDTFSNGYNLHEGGFYQPVNMVDSFNFFINNDDTSVLLEGKFNADYGQLEITETIFKKKTHHQLSFTEAKDIFDFIKKALFSEKYLGFDSTGAFIDTVKLLDNNKITGLYNYYHYDFVPDFMGPGMNLDQVQLGKDDRDQNYLGWKLDADTLFLYHLICTEKLDSFHATDYDTCDTYKNGDVFVKLVKMK